MCSRFLSRFSINLLAYYHECRSLISYALTIYLNNRVFLSKNYRLTVVPRKFDVLKTYIVLVFVHNFYFLNSEFFLIIPTFF